jgi:PAS domain S-box-containing protein
VIRRGAQLLLGAGALAGLTALYVGATAPDIERHRAVTARLHELKQVDAHLRENLLGSRFNLLMSYDPLVADVQRLRDIHDELATAGVEAAGHDRRVVRTTRKVGVMLARLELLLDDFKSRNAILRNSLRFFPVAALEVDASLVRDRVNLELRESLNRLVQDVLALAVGVDKGQQARVESIMWVLGAERPDVDALLAHVRAILEQLREVDRLLRTVAALPTAAAYEALDGAHHAVYALALRRSNLYRVYLYGTGVVLIACVSVVLLRLGRSTAALRRAVADLQAQRGELDALNHDLEGRVRTRTEETEAIIAALSSFLLSVDGRGAITHWNRAAERLFARPAGAVIGRPWAECGIRWDWDTVRNQVDRIVASGRWGWLDDVVYTRPDGTMGIVKPSLAPVVSPDGSRGFVMTGNDVTEQRTLQSQLDQAQRLESVGRLAAGIAHEINTPIQFVGDNTRFLKDAFARFEDMLAAYRRYAEGGGDAALLAATKRAEEEADVGYLVEEVPKAIEQALDGVSRVASIVRAMKEFAHPDRGDKVRTDLNQALVSTLTVARNELKYVADVETDLGDLPSVPCYVGELNQAFLNILVNAAHAIGDVVQSTGARGTIRVRTWRDDGQVAIAIADTGGGIPDGIRERIFDPFFTTKDVGRGTGQGLAIARNVIVEKHGGSLSFETEVGRGTTFIIRLPVGNGADSVMVPA